MTTKFTIKKLIAGVWMYYTEHYNDGAYDEVRNWFADPAIAERFESYPDAETFLNTYLKDTSKGLYQIDKFFINE